jgi:hypothetical protein
MTVHNRSTAAKRVARIIAGLSITMVVVGLILTVGISGRPANVVIDIAYTVLAVLIVSRQPRNTVGWLFLMVGFFSALETLGSGLSALEYFSNSELGLRFGWLGSLLWIPVLLVPITLVLQFFPDGRLPSRRWWPVTVAALLGMTGMAASIAFHPWPWEEIDILEGNNPFAIAGSEQFFESLLEVAYVFLAIGLVGSLVAVIVRFLRSRGIERTQMKWLVYTAVGMLPLLLLPQDSPVQQLSFRLMPVALAAAITIAILRYQLFDIDVIIRKTVVYAVLTGLLALVYFGVVILLQSIIETVSGQQSPIGIVISTLIIAALFAPLRRRVQDFIDRRFYRRRYDAEKTLAAFGQFVRDETNMEALTAELLRVTEETMQPEQATLWLNLTPDGPGRARASQPAEVGSVSAATPTDQWRRH